MTVGVAYRVPGLGAVLVSDGRITHSDEIVSDHARKFVVCGSTAAVLAGTVGALWRQLQEKPPRSFAALRAAVAADPDETDWLAYDRRSDRLWAGEVRLVQPFAAIGSGASLALGALEALPLARSMPEAERHALTAVRAACRRNVTCGGKLRVLRVPRKGAVSE